jgi:hypothetical protein
MQEFTTASSSSYDPAALAAKLTSMSSEGWTVVSIVSTGGDVTAFLSRDAGTAATTAAATVAATEPAAAAEPAPTSPAAEPAVAEPAGWAVAPDPAPATVEPQAASTYTSAAPAAAAATPAVPAGWYADPAGRFELRYWDGATWTEHVSRAGQQYTDPPVA